LERRGKHYLAWRGRNLIATGRFVATGSIRENVKFNLNFFGKAIVEGFSSIHKEKN
jgi:hypothetical protein